ALLRRIQDGKFDAADRILDVDEGAGLMAAAVNREGMLDCGLDEKTIKDGAEIAVIVEAVDQPFGRLCLLGLRAPYDALVQVRDPHAVVLIIEREEELVLRLG